MTKRKVKNEWIINEEYAELKIIGLTHGEFILKIDLDDYIYCKEYVWNMQRANSGERSKYKSKKYYAYSNIDGKQTLLHRYIMKVRNSKEIVDHINGDERDNRKSNMRICTIKENVRNSSMYKNNKSGYKGVHWNKKLNKWGAGIMVDYKYINLGTFDNIDDAICVRREAELKYFDEFSPLKGCLKEEV